MLEQKRARVNGVDYAYLDSGKGRPMLMLHGWPEHSGSWRRIAPYLTDTFRVIAPDFRGCGDTAVTADGFDKKTLARDAKALLDHLDIDKAIIVGHDWGAPVAYRLVLDFPDLASGLIIFNGRLPLLAQHTDLMFTPQQVRERWYFFFNLVPDLPEIMIGRAMTEFYSTMFAHWSGTVPSHDAAEIAEIVRCNSRRDGLKGGLGFYRTAVGKDVADWKEHTGAVLDMPSLILWGARDPVLPPIYIEGVATVTPDLEIHLNDDAGHFIQAEQPEWCARHMRDFIARRLI